MKRVIRSDKPVTLVFPVKLQKCDFGTELSAYWRHRQLYVKKALCGKSVTMSVNTIHLEERRVILEQAANLEHP
jgi:hypothetical protein